jgi:hypothetical protein
MHIILQGNLPVSIPRQFHLKRVEFGVNITTDDRREIEECTLQFYHSKGLVEPFERKFKLDRTQPIKNLLFDLDETEFKLYADMCKVVWPELIEDDEVVIIPLF